MTLREIAIIGGGALGSSLAINLSRRKEIRWIVRSSADAAEILRTRTNPHYLPDHRIPDAIHVTTDIAAGLASADLALVATPTAAFASVVGAVADARPGLPVIWGCKGFCPRTGELLSAAAAEILTPGTVHGALSGPGFAEGLASGDPTALVVATNAGKESTLAVAEALSNESLRVYANPDLIGVQICGAIKNVYAIAAGIIDGCGWGVNTRAAMMTRAIAETRVLLKAWNGKRSTLVGLSGFGDFHLTCGSRQSRNYQVGMALASGVPLARALETLGHVAEGVQTARLICGRAEAAGIEMPLARAVNEILDGVRSPRECAAALMARDIRSEKKPKAKSAPARNSRLTDLV
ncbi:MAG: NAD(P)-dependent glycerol-3-phosphate dehydrogenase [Verrucomicrobiae bacterium]|nr:NAD(P)-dependent glycerol-3-phosphate dehydrogenase [Verrucomicrobiae bacterium]MCP5533551.1 NAD(P)-dependent glycerol-3-phosphate dehydrogenase [Akkermansiaceae bacterium]MCP5542487.1 NAD(P)-dependent glycerol-3-phosphate dehydrogenase [Akkermansiaceae bacterium]MCP5545978.1 NAD(P)-dependent glycerol-3-phosphate dehydrogenase [Akkermansiaceae bacterium]